ncbi:MAG: cytochrome c oxidase assembly protein [Actinomycetota bacterium]
MKLTPLAVLALLGTVSVLVDLYRNQTRSNRWLRFDGLALGSWFTLWWATSSPFATSAMLHLPLHMVAHIFVMFLVPIGLVYSGAGALLAGLVFTTGEFPWAKWSRSRFNHPLLGFILLNGVMIASHLPAVFNATMSSSWAMDWLMEPLFLFSGIYFFTFIVQSPAKQQRTQLRWQLLLVLGTMLEMLILAMSMSIFTKVAWYPMMSTMNMGHLWRPTPHDFSEQQLAAAILWVCGDFWAVPCLVVIVRRIMVRDGGLLAALDRQSSRFS